MTGPRRPDLDDMFVRARLELSELGRKALERYRRSMRPGLSKATRRAERRIAERRAREALEKDNEENP